MTDYAKLGATLSSYGRKGGVINKNDNVDLPDLPKAIEVTVGGTLEVLPVGNADGAWVDCGVCDKGYQPPFRVRRVRQASTATVIGIWD